METSPLVLGHDYARAASLATHASDTVLAIGQHTLAAGEFSKAANNTNSTEAIRILRLLRQHHHRMSEILRSTSEISTTTTLEQESQTSKERRLVPQVVIADYRTQKPSVGTHPSPAHRNPPALRRPRRLPPRDLSSSIASNLATARGIRANYTRQPLSPTISKSIIPGSLEVSPRREENRHGAPSISENISSNHNTLAINSRNKKPKAEVMNLEQLSGSNDGFARFYSKFENIITKISAPLAFAGLPLITGEFKASNTSSEPKQYSSRPNTSNSELDLSKHFSRAALRASARDDYGANDSFCVVPTTGHTLSYAHILSFDQKERRRMAGSSNSENPLEIMDPNDEDDFVDARETPMPRSPFVSRDKSRPLSSRDKDNKIEELTIENTSLKTAIDKLSKRLHTFEVSAQCNSMALAESMRLLRDFSPGRRETGKSHESKGGMIYGDKLLKQQVKELEEKLLLEAKENDSIRKENEKLRIVLTKYRERWEKLKEGAKSRRESKDGVIAST